MDSESLVVLILMSLSSLMVVFLPVDGEIDGENETLYKTGWFNQFTTKTDP